MSEGLLNNEYAELREKKRSHIFRYKLRAWAAVSSLKRLYGQSSGLSLLDVGCAEGRALKYINEIFPGNDLIGVEASKELVSAGRKLYPDLNIFEGYAEDIATTAGISREVDVALALAVLEHVPDPLLFLKSVGKVLRDDGCLIASTPVPFWDEIAVKAGLLDDGQHIEHLDQKRLISLFREAGFEVLKYKRFMWGPWGVLPCLGILPSMKLTVWVDSVLSNIPGVNWLCVNQLVVARKVDVMTHKAVK